MAHGGVDWYADLAWRARSLWIDLQEQTGTRIWEMVQQTADEDTIVTTLLGEYDVEESMARSEVRRILDELIDAQLIVPA